MEFAHKMICLFIGFYFQFTQTNDIIWWTNWKTLQVYKKW